ncbi:phage integrase SAM-like domain-containing protein [Chryseobacterium defluvii]|uniref:phage integrase SAM-like domain-containing protein n=1 Tax=Chryseobacterium defluvii TaxID=160396 RepID=UPI00161E09A9
MRQLAPEAVTKNLKIENTIKSLKEKKKGILIVFDKFIEVRRQEKSENIVKTYRTCKNHLEKFSNETKFNLSFENIPSIFMMNYS